MSGDKYAIRFDETTGRAYVDLSGKIDPGKIIKTFAAIALNQKWAAGDRSVLWNAQKALLTESFEFTDIFFPGDEPFRPMSVPHPVDKLPDVFTAVRIGVHPFAIHGSALEFPHVFFTVGKLVDAVAIDTVAFEALGQGVRHNGKHGKQYHG